MKDDTGRFSSNRFEPQDKARKRQEISDLKREMTTIDDICEVAISECAGRFGDVGPIKRRSVRRCLGVDGEDTRKENMGAMRGRRQIYSMGGESKLQRREHFEGGHPMKVPFAMDATEEVDEAEERESEGRQSCCAWARETDGPGGSRI